jgi:cytochrome c oxidase assembly protein subunit 15
LVFLLFFFGGLVRATGSGMGCPDWPKCFGKTIPPMSEDELPEGYEEEFKTQRLEKINRLVAVLKAIGLNKKAAELESNKHILKSHPYNKAQMLIEWINRLVGALSGLFALIAFILSFQFLRTMRWKFVWTLLAFIGILVNAFLGSIVVQTNLLEGMVSIHFIAAFLTFMAFVLAWNYGKTLPADWKSPGQAQLMKMLLVFTAVQVITGTFSREAVDLMHRAGEILTTHNLGELGSNFILHRVLAILLLVGFGFYYLRERKTSRKGPFKQLTLGMLALIILQIVSGTVNILQDFPAGTQVLHITLGAGSFALCFIAYLTEKRTFVPEKV